MKSAAIRALRTAAQTLAGALVGLPTVQNVLDIQEIGNPLAVALYVAVLAGVVSFLQNVAEDNTSLNIPKG